MSPSDTQVRTIGWGSSTTSTGIDASVVGTASRMHMRRPQCGLESPVYNSYGNSYAVYCTVLYADGIQITVL